MIALLQPWYSYNFLITPSASAWDSLRFFGPAKFRQYFQIGEKSKEDNIQSVSKISNRLKFVCVLIGLLQKIGMGLEWSVAKKVDIIPPWLCRRL